MKRLLPENPRLRAVVYGAAAVLATLIFTQLVLPGSGGSAGRGTPAAILFQGLVTGSILAVFTTSIILVYRTIRVINFAQGPIGSIGGALALLLLQFTQVPFLICVVIALVVSAAVGAGVGLFMLRFFRSSRLLLTVITIVGAASLRFLFPLVRELPFFPNESELTSDDQALTPEELRALLPFRGLRFFVGSFDLPFGFAHLFALEICILAIVGVMLFLRFTRAGVAVKALAENPERASLLGIGVAGLSVMVWAIAGLLDGVGIVAAGVGAASVGSGFEVLLPLLAAATIAKFRSIETGLLACLIIGVTQEAWGHSLRSDRDLFSVALFLVVGIGLVLQRRSMGRSETGEVSWAATNEPRPIPKELSRIGSIRFGRLALYAIGLIAVIAFPFVASTNRVFLAGVVSVNAIAVLSLVVLTGWAGQVSLGQYALVAIGSVTGGALTSRVGVPFWLAVPLGTAITAAIAVVVGLPALRIKGLFLMITTFGLAVAVQAVLFDERYFKWLLPQTVERPTLFFLDFDDERSMYFLCVAALVTAIVVVGNLRRSRVGRVLIALRENEANLQSLGVTAVRAKLLAFGIAGALAGFAGVVFAHQQRGVSIESFGADASVQVFTQAVIGGVSSAGGALLGSAYFVLTQEFLGNNVVIRSFILAGGPLAVIFLAPGGLISLVNSMRDSILRIVAQRRRIVVPSLFADYDPDVLERQLIPLAEPDNNSGLAAMPIDQRFALTSELYQGPGERVVDKLGPAKEDADKLAISAAASSFAEREREPEAATAGAEKA